MIYLMRHGMDDETKVGGWSDIDLTPEGERQVAMISRKLMNEVSKEVTGHPYRIEKIIASDIKRARQTAGIVNYYFNLPLTYDSRLKEQDKGDLTGLPILLAKRKYPDYFREIFPTTKYPNGESLLDLYNRVEKLLPWILKQERSLLVTHRGVINMLYYLLNDIPLDMNKSRFDVVYGSVHELDSQKMKIHRQF